MFAIFTKLKVLRRPKDSEPATYRTTVGVDARLEIPSANHIAMGAAKDG